MPPGRGAEGWCTVSCDMMRIVFGTVLAFSAVAAAQECFTGCRFEFCDGRHEFWLRRAGVPFTGAICYKDFDTPVGVVGESDEAYLVEFGREPRFTAISKWRPPGLRQHFSSSFFKTVTLRRNSYYLKHSGVARETFQQNQRDFLDRRCFIRSVQTWQELDRFGRVVINRPSDDWADCVAFRTRTG